MTTVKNIGKLASALFIATLGILISSSLSVNAQAENSSPKGIQEQGHTKMAETAISPHAQQRANEVANRILRMGGYINAVEQVAPNVELEKDTRESAHAQMDIYFYMFNNYYQPVLQGMPKEAYNDQHIKNVTAKLTDLMQDINSSSDSINNLEKDNRQITYAEYNDLEMKIFSFYHNLQRLARYLQQKKYL